MFLEIFYLHRGSYIIPFMSGHNKWAQIKRQKGAADAAKSNLWGKLGKRIAVESKKANGDVNAANLRAIIETAKKTNMPKDTIERAVAKGISADAASLEQVTYEAYGPGGAAVIIEAVTDNKNRTLQELKGIFAKHDIALAAPGSALWACEKTDEGYAPKTAIPLSEDDSANLMKIMEL